MFAGIVESVCRVATVRPGIVDAHGCEAVRLEVELGELLRDLKPGASVAVNGACLTLVEQHGSVAGFDVVPETWRRTNLQSLQPGDWVNVERSLRVGDRVDGHFVQGHVDGVGVVDHVERGQVEYKLWIAAPADLMPYIVRKGSIAIDGVSLTIVDVEENRFSVVLIPTTLAKTVLRERHAGDQVNIETDILARIAVSRLAGAGGRTAGVPVGVTWERLAESGFLP
jgi:riboflavin synthase